MRRLLGWGLLFILIGCASEAPQDSVLSLEQPRYISPFQHRKVQIDDVGMEPEPADVTMDLFSDWMDRGARLEERVIPSGTRLVGIIDNRCLNAHSWSYGQELSSRITQFAMPSSTQMEIQAYGFEVAETTTLRELESRAQADLCVRGIVPDSEWELVTTSEAANDKNIGQQEFHEAIGSAAGWKYFYESKHGIRSRAEVVVAVVDTGVDATHEDLKNVMWQNADGSFGANTIDDTPETEDTVGHGTHVAGLIGAEMDNGVGIAGVAGAHTRIMSVKVFARGGRTTTEAIINGIRWAVDHGAEVINLSLGGPRPNAGLLEVLQYAVEKGVVVLAAAGNNGRELGRLTLMYPAMYGKRLQGVITVGSIHSHNGKLSGFSNRSTEYVELAAPGSHLRRWWGSYVGIYSTLPKDKYGRLSGTSMATPVAAGAVSLMLGYLKANSLDLGTPAAIESLLLQGSVQDPQLQKQVTQGHRLDLNRLSQVMEQEIAKSVGSLP